LYCLHQRLERARCPQVLGIKESWAMRRALVQGRATVPLARTHTVLRIPVLASATARVASSSRAALHVDNGGDGKRGERGKAGASRGRGGGGRGRGGRGQRGGGAASGGRGEPPAALEATDVLRLYDVAVALDDDPGKDHVAPHEALKAAVHRRLKGIQVRAPTARVR
jgi:hypothetical protein